MKRIVLIACASKKLDHPAAAWELYQSTLFRLSYEYARQLDPDAVFILSAKHRLLSPEKKITPYDVTLNDMPAAEVRAWAKGVIAELGERFDLERDHFIFLAGNRYRKYLLPHVASYEIPLEGLRIGEQLQFLKEKTG